MRRIFLLLTALALSGCAAISAKFENVPTCSLTRDRAFVSSMYGPFGLVSEITERYVSAMCPPPAAPAAPAAK